MAAKKRTQRDSEDFGYALCHFAMSGFRKISSDAREEWVIDQFVSRLDNVDMRRHVQLSHPATLEKAISMTTEYESYFASMKTLPRMPVNMVSETTQSCKREKGLGEAERGIFLG